MDMEGTSVEEVIAAIQTAGVTGKNGSIAVWYPFHSVKKLRVELR